MIRSFSFSTIRHLAIAGCFAVILPVSLHGQMGNDNPTGVSGVYNGNVATAGSYDPYTGNATRSVTDISVAGAVGAYPLAFTRTMNSRYTPGAGTLEFGASGSWRHSYQWTIEPLVYQSSNPVDKWSFLPLLYTVDYPDGRRISFNPANNGDTRFRGGPGISDRFQQLADTNGGACYLLLPDGGKVWFDATVDREEDEQTGIVTSTFTYQLLGIIDPYGQTTTVTYGANTMTIQEPAGRTLTVYYISTPWNGDTVIDSVVASDGRSVKYNYGGVQPAGATMYSYLGNVQYLDNNGVSYAQAIYAYQQSNIDPDGRMLLSWAIDPMYAGPMWAIAYNFVAGSSGGVYGQLQSENYLDPFTGSVGQVVSTLSANANTRTETRGDGPMRTFNYSGGKLDNYTDFRGHTSYIYYDGNGFTSAFTDARQHTTSTQREGLIGALTTLTHPDPEQSTQAFSYPSGVPYFVQYQSDEKPNNNTFFTRDSATNRVTKIWYPDYDPNNPNADPTEEFTYNIFGQVLTHKMTSDGVENFRYDGRGLMYLSWPPATSSDPNPELHPTQYFYYTSGAQMDRLRQVVDPRGYSTSFEYNTRGQITKVTHDQDGTYAQSGYNVDGTVAWTANENHPSAATDVGQRTRYAYDIYKRVISVTNPMNETTTLSYAPTNGSGSYAHTTKSIYQVTTPLSKITTLDYDENFRRTMVRKGFGSPDDDGGTHFGYDEVGNLTSVQDPRGNITTFAYDERNRRTSATSPPPFDNLITRWEYDTRSNLTKETRPDLSFRRMEYDSLSRVIDTYGFANEHTHYQRDLAGNVVQMADSKTPTPATYFFGYDKMNRKTSVTYPLDATQSVRGESWHYDFAGNIDQYMNPAGKTKTLGYDTRNRFISASWEDGVGPTVGLGYDDASRLTIVTTNNNETQVVFGYDNANRKTWEEQTVAGYPTYRVETPRDSDGYRASLSVSGLYGVSYDYTKRGQLSNIHGGGPASWFTYKYDLAGNMTNRQDVLGGVNDSTNITDASGVSQYDALNRPTMWEQVGKNNGWFGRSHFNYDALSRLTASWRDEQASKGEWYAYETTGQLKQVKYNATQVWTGNPLSPNRTVTYTATPDTLNRAKILDGNYTYYTPDALNQYEMVGGAAVSYDENFNLTGIWGFSATYDAQNRLTSASSGEDAGEFVYDGLGRCLKRTIDGDSALIVYDGWKPILEFDDWNGMSWNVYGPGADEILYRHDATHGDLRYHLDRMGNVAFVLDSDGDGIEKYTYDAFGKPTVTTWTGTSPRSYSWYGNRFMFQGREYLTELGIYDFRNRYYMAGLGRFLQKDPLGFGGGDANLFRYCNGDPVNHADPLGLGLWNDIKRYFTEDKNSGPGTATTAPIIVRAPLIETAESAGMGPQGPLSSLDAGPNDHGIGGGLSNMGELARDWLGDHHPELKPRQRDIREGPVGRDLIGRPNISQTNPFTKQITIDPSQIHSVADYVETLSHELMHANDSFLQNVLDWFYIGGNHEQIYQKSRQIGNEYRADTGGGG